MLDIKDTVLAIIDIQGKPASLMHGKSALYRNLPSSFKRRFFKISQLR